MNDPLVMIVDDDPDIREGLHDLLVDDGFKVATAKHGQDALDQLTSGVDARCIVLDLMMPVMDGYQFYERWHADPRLRKIPLVIVSASQVSDAAKTFAAAAGFIAKPLKVDRLLELVSRHARAA